MRISNDLFLTSDKIRGSQKLKIGHYVEIRLPSDSVVLMLFLMSLKKIAARNTARNVDP